jgi:hypothetical protein
MTLAVCYGCRSLGYRSQLGRYAKLFEFDNNTDVLCAGSREAAGATLFWFTLR